MTASTQLQPQNRIVHPEFEFEFESELGVVLQQRTPPRGSLAEFVGSPFVEQWGTVELIGRSPKTRVVCHASNRQMSSEMISAQLRNQLHNCRFSLFRTRVSELEERPDNT
jgi:hypothetical protein